jgi:exopolysaccharide biosynthesis polyprenyl glycosylphosphotransferase
MATVTNIGIGRSTTAAMVDPCELLAVVDARTRGLIGRRATARRGPVLRRGLVLADLAGLSIAFAAAWLAYGSGGLGDRLDALDEYLLFAASLPIWIVVAKLHGLYERDEQRADNSTADDIVGVFHLVTIGVWLLFVGSSLSGLAQPTLPKLIAFWLFASCAIPIARATIREACRRRAAFQQNTVIVGAGDVGQLIARKFIQHPEYGINVVGFVDRRPKSRRPDLPEHLSILGPPEALKEIVERLGIERVVLSFSSDPASETLEIVRRLRDLNVQLDLVPRLFEVIGPKGTIHTVEGLALIGLPPARLTRSSSLMKRAIDVVGASLMLVVTAPLFAYIAIRIHNDSPGPILFRQRRLGCAQKEFTTLKFRTMRLDADTAAHQAYIQETMSADASLGANGSYKLDRADAVTPFGRWLRKTSLDELPQLINVLRGDMSLVGPRPCIPYEVQYFKSHHFERFVLPQGLTGLWQVTARANATFGEALDMDVAYVRGWSLGLDLRLLIRTPLQVIRQRRSTA